MLTAIRRAKRADEPTDSIHPNDSLGLFVMSIKTGGNDGLFN